MFLRKANGEDETFKIKNPDNWNEFLNMLNEETGANLKIPTQKQ